MKEGGDKRGKGRGKWVKGSGREKGHRSGRRRGMGKGIRKGKGLDSEESISNVKRDQHE